jgi:hypothetical protein
MNFAQLRRYAFTSGVGVSVVAFASAPSSRGGSSDDCPPLADPK